MIYLSHHLNEKTPLYGGENKIVIKKDNIIDKGKTANTLHISMPNHSGTHVDVPRHFFNDGNTLSDYPASFWVFQKPQLIDIPCEDGQLIEPSDVNSELRTETDILFIRTGYEQFRNQEQYWKKNPGLSVSLAKNLRTKFPNIGAVGVDVISITSRLHRDEGREAHCEFLGDHYKSDPIVLIEDMSLLNYTEDISQVIICPLIIEYADGSPCTIIAG